MFFHLSLRVSGELLPPRRPPRPRARVPLSTSCGSLASRSGSPVAFFYVFLRCEVDAALEKGGALNREICVVEVGGLFGLTDRYGGCGDV